MALALRTAVSRRASQSANSCSTRVGSNRATSRRCSDRRCDEKILMGVSTRHGLRDNGAALPSSPLPEVRDLSSSSAPIAETISFTVARGRSGLESIRHEWQALVDRPGAQVALAHAPPWYDAYLQTCADPDRVCFFVAHRRGDLV